MRVLVYFCAGLLYGLGLVLIVLTMVAMGSG